MKIQILMFSICLSLFAQAQDFTWMRGSNQSGIPGVYGTLGQSSPTIDPGGRHGAGKWIDQNGDLWMFGGEGYSTSSISSWLNDLWKYTISTNQWTWMGGSPLPNQATVFGSLSLPAVTNQPGAREFPLCWTDTNGMFWMLGGFGFGANPSQVSPERLGDLWRYDPATNLWTWMGGFNINMQNGNYGTLGVPSTSNRPGSRVGSATWVDAAGDLWLFGGRGFPASGFEGFLNDIWRYKISTSEWTWMGGTDLTGQAGVFGTIGVPSISNLPGGKEFPASWQDALGRVYLFGGRSTGYFNDLWRFDPTANTWTWLKGANFGNQAGTYGNIGVPATANVPGGRFSQASWTDDYGQFWMFGGQGWSATTLNDLNDLWKYDPCTNNWTWIKGRDTTNTLGTYGTVLVPATTNMPGSRIYNDYWTGKNKRVLWLVGGEGFDASNFITDHMNDVWKYDVVAPSDSIFSVAGGNICSANQATLNAATGATSTIQWYSTVTSTLSLFTGAPYITSQLNAGTSPVSYTYFAQVACTARPRVSVQFTVNPLPQISITGTNQTCEGNFTLAASGAATYTWINGSNNSTATFSASAPNFTAFVLGTSSLGCENSASHTISILPNPTLNIASTNTAFCVNAPATLSVSGANSYSWANNNSQNTYSLTSSSASLILVNVSGTGANGCVSASSIEIQFLKCTNIKDLNMDQKLVFYPNPSSGAVLITLPQNADYQLEIHSALGQILYQEKESNEKIELDLGLSAGLYFLQVQQNGIRYLGRLVITEK